MKLRDLMKANLYPLLSQQSVYLSVNSEQKMHKETKIKQVVSKSEMTLVIEVTNDMNMTCLTVTMVECDVIEMNDAVMKVVEYVTD